MQALRSAVPVSDLHLKGVQLDLVQELLIANTLGALIQSRSDEVIIHNST